MNYIMIIAIQTYALKMNIDRLCSILEGKTKANIDELIELVHIITLQGDQLNSLIIKGRR